MPKTTFFFKDFFFQNYLPLQRLDMLLGSEICFIWCPALGQNARKNIFNCKTNLFVIIIFPTGRRKYISWFFNFLQTCKLLVNGMSNQLFLLVDGVCIKMTHPQIKGPSKFFIALSWRVPINASNCDILHRNPHFVHRLIQEVPKPHSTWLKRQCCMITEPRWRCSLPAFGSHVTLRIKWSSEHWLMGVRFSRKNVTFSKILAS